MSEALFAGRDSVRVRALCLGERMDLRTLEMGRRLAAAPLVVAVGKGGCAALFRYGVAVLFGLEPIEEATLLDQLRPTLGEAYAQPQTEDLLLQLNEGRAGEVAEGVVFLKRFTADRIQAIADALAKSVVLAHYEARVAQAFDFIEPLAGHLQEGRRYRRGGELMRYIGSTLMIQHRMVGRVEVAEKPDLLWDKPELERLYLRLQDEYELKDRHIALERKLGLIGQTAETLLDILRNQRSHRVEWYIVILIVVEIFLTLYQMFLKGP